MKEEEVNRCQIQEWYPKFKHVSIKTIIHKLPESFVQYLLDDGPFVLPHSVSGKMRCLIESTISKKRMTTKFLKCSAPKDSAWIATTGTLQCTSFSEISLLLRSSESLVHDLCHAFDSCVDKSLLRPPKFFLALRKWYSSLRPEMEFRCFARSKLLVAISQREVTCFYPVLLEKKDNLQMLIHDFFVDNVQERFESDNYTFDVYVTRDGRVKLIDFNPWGAFTLPLMFTWEELEDFEGGENTIRIVDRQCAVRPGIKTAVPYDYLDTSLGSGWGEVLRKADEELQRQSQYSEAGA
ncbi:hypothetical protein Sjap_010807 [Stephania japonica]|uniref:Cell division cycle protein 123 homolog n=1 Tax=Stephania japonica TaxID=461633 RepID=A0AAP0JBY8_9MAGN